MSDNLKHSEVTNLIIKAYYQVYNKLGYGFMEKIYHRAMILELQNYLTDVVSQKNLKVYYEGVEIGNYYADLVVNGCVIVELKAVGTITTEHEVQLVNYLKASNIEVGIILNFGPEPEFKRRVFTNDKKRHKFFQK